MRSKKQGQAKANLGRKACARTHVIFPLCGFDFVLPQQLRTEIADRDLSLTKWFE